MLIMIPSRGRYTAAEIARGPLKFIPDVLRWNTSYHVRSDESEKYSGVLGVSTNNVGLVSLDYQGIGDKRRLMGEYASQVNHDKFLMIDDDVNFLVRRDEDKWQLQAQTQTDFFEMFTEIEKLLDVYASVGISAREGNNRQGIGPAPLLVENTRVMRVLAYRTKEFLECEHARVPLMEDFDVQLQLLRKGHKNACLFYWANGQSQTNAPGGCSLVRTHEVQDAAAHKLAELHPGFVRLRQKTNKTDAAGLGTRTEVTIGWKSAAAAGASTTGGSGSADGTDDDHR